MSLAEALAVWDPLTELELLARRAGAVDGLTQAVTAAVGPQTGATAACITLWDRERDVLHALPGAFGTTDRERPASITGPATNPRSVAARVFASGEPSMCNRARDNGAVLQEYVDLFGIQRVISVPLDLPAGRLGVLVLANKPTDFTDEDLARARELAPRVAEIVDLALTLHELRTQRRLERILATTAVAIASGRSVRDCTVAAFEELGPVTGTSLAALVPVDGDAFVWRTATPGRRIEARFLADAAALSRRSTGRLPRAAGDPGWAALHVPVVLDGERIAALSVLRRNGEPYTSSEAEVLVRLADILSLAWAGERYQHQRAELARSRERERIADELHDRVVQIVFAAQLGLDAMAEDGVGDGDRIREIRGLLAKGEGAVREVIERLEAHDEHGLTQRLHHETATVEDEFGVAIHTDVASGIDALPRRIADCLVRVAREATVNAAKHAGPCRICLTVEADDAEVTLTVLDDGVGLRPEPLAVASGHGLRSLRRAVADAGGTLDVAGPADALGGVTVRAAFPRT